MYRSGVAPWNSASWKPSGRLQVHRAGEVHQNDVKEKGSEEEFVEQQ